MEKIEFMLGKHWDCKPNKDEEYAMACRSHCKRNETLKFLAEKLVDGYSFMPGVLIGGFSKANWVSQRLFALDFDSKDKIMQIEEVYNFYINLGITPCFIYTTSSHSINLPKFRVVFCVNESINDGHLRDKLQATLMGLTDCCDIKCTNKARYFFGSMSHEVLHPNYDARIDTNSIIEKHWKNTSQFTKYLPSESNNKMPSKLKKQKNTNITTNNLESNADAIINLDYKALKESLGSMSYEYIDEINLAEYLGVQEDKSFCCILPDHDDAHPSANIFKINDSQFYICHGCKYLFNIIEITCELSGCTIPQAIEFLKNVYDIKYAYFLIEQYSNIYQEFINFLDTENFINKYPNLNEILGVRKDDLKLILLYMANKISVSYQLNKKPIFFLSTPTLLSICDKKSNDYISKSITLFCFLGLLSKPELETLSNKIKKETKEIQYKHKLKNHINYFQVNDINEEALQACEYLAMSLRNKGFNFKGLSREYILLNFGIEKANTVFPQYKDKNKVGLAPKSKTFIYEKTKLILRSIKKNGYIIETNLFSLKSDEILWRTIAQTTLSSNKLKRIRLNKQYKESHNIKCNGYPYIIVREYKSC